MPAAVAEEEKMKKFASIVAGLVAAVMLISATACDPDEPIAATGIVLDQTELSLTVGESVTLTATVTPDNATDKSVTWTSSDPAVATVEGGEVTAIAEGGATITAACGEVSASVSCTVSAAQQPVRTTVTEAEWEAAFAEEHFENFCMKVSAYEYMEAGGEPIPLYTMEYTAADGKRHLVMSGVGEFASMREETYEVYTDTSITSYSKQADGSWQTAKLEYTGDCHVGIRGIPLSAWRALRGKYEEFTPPSEEEAYYTATVEVVGEGVDSGANPSTDRYKVWFRDGVLYQVESIPVETNGSAEAITVSFTFGGQSIDELPPEVGTIS